MQNLVALLQRHLGSDKNSVKNVASRLIVSQLLIYPAISFQFIHHFSNYLANKQTNQYT